MKAIGVDIIEIPRIAAALNRHGDRFLKRVFTPQEQAYCRGRVASLAARWAAKEAMGKAFGTGLGHIAFRDIEVINNAQGKPSLRLHGPAQHRAAALNFTHIELSLSHAKEFAIAFVVVA